MPQPHTLICLPGLDGSGLLFGPLLQALPAGIAARVLPYPGDRPLSYPQLAEHLAPALPQQPYYLLGESFGGPLAMLLAARSSDHLQGLILSCTFAQCPHPLLTRLQATVDHWPLHNLPIEMLERVVFGRRCPQSLRLLLQQAMRRNTAGVLAARLRAVAGCDLRAELVQLTAPVLLLRARRDWLVPRAAGRRLQQMLKQPQVVELAAPHGLLQVQAPAAAAAIAAFCDQHALSGSAS